jgi:hypothetical protein
LTGTHFEDAAAMLDTEEAAEHDRDLFELRALPGLTPATGRDHPGDADLLFTGACASDVLFDFLRLGTGCRDDGWIPD